MSINTTQRQVEKNIVEIVSKNERGFVTSASYRVHIYYKDHDFQVTLPTLEDAKKYRDFCYEQILRDKELDFKKGLNIKDFPYNLYDELCLSGVGGISSLDDLVGGEEKFVDNIDEIILDLSKLNNRERDIIKDVYVKEQSLSFIGKELGISRERVRQILNASIHKILLGCKRWKEKMALEAKEAEKEFLKDLAKAYADSGLIDKELYESAYGLDLESVKEFLSREAYETAGIEELDLSIRAWNCLKRAGISRICDVPKTVDELIKIKNMGKKSANEIIGKVSQYLGAY